MPSDSNGNYSLPPGYLATTGDPILASQHNPPLEDLASSMSQRVLKTGATPMSGPLQLADGTVAAPGLTFGSANGTGIFKTANGWAVTIAGVQVFEFSSAPQGRIPGEIVTFAGASAPSGWLLCAGQSLLRTAYPALFANIGTLSGAVDSLHFNIPDAREVVIAGNGGMAAPPRNILTGSSAFGALLGNETAGLSVGHLPSYTLPKTLGVSLTGSISLSAAAGNVVNAVAGSGANMTGGGGALLQGPITLSNTLGVSLTGDTQSGGGNAPHPNVQPTLILNVIIYTGVP